MQFGPIGCLDTDDLPDSLIEEPRFLAISSKSTGQEGDKESRNQVHEAETVQPPWKEASLGSINLVQARLLSVLKGESKDQVWLEHY